MRQGRPMSLQKKIVVMFIVLGAVFSLGSYAGLTTFVFPAFEDFEQESATQNLVRIRRAIDADLHSLDIVNREYSEWDHTYQFVLGLRDDYVAENLDIAYWNNIDLNMMLFFDLDGEMIWGAIVDRSVRNELPVADELLQPLTSAHPLLHHRSDPGVTLGLLQTRSAPMMVASRPILTSAAQGPPVGTLVIGKYLDANRVSDLAERAGVDVAFHLLDDQSVPREYKVGLAGAAGNDAATHWMDEEARVTGFQEVTDVFGIPAFVLEVSTPKKITGIGHKTINTALVYFLLATVVSLLAAWLFTRNLIVTPVTKLTRHILRIKKTGNLDEPVESVRNDEVGVLAQEFGDLATKFGAAQRELESARDQALAISNAKTEFLARMSHEIRTPMNGVLGMIELLNSTPLTQTQMRYARSSHEAAKTLLDIINDVLDFSKIEAGKLRLENVRFELNPFLTDITNSLLSLAEQKGLRLSCVVPEGPSMAVEGDPLRLRQVLTNLIGNAIKFTERGSVLLQVSARPGDDDRSNILFEVIDTGVGITPRKQRHIFASFAQEDGSTTRRFGGTGLGLSISKQLVELMGGNIRLKSRPNKGSTFSFELCVKACDELSDSARSLQQHYYEATGEPTVFNQLQGRVLIAEDNAVNQAVAVGMLTGMGVDSVAVKNGRDAVEAFCSDDFDAVLMDCQMPMLDGYQATKEIRNFESLNRKDPVRIIAVTANALAGDMQKCVAAGMDDYLAKPFTSDQLYIALKNVLRPGDPVMTEQVDRQEETDSVVTELPDMAVAIDWTVLDALSNLPQSGRQKLVNRVIETYLMTSREQMANLGKAIDNGDSDYVRDTAHALRASSANVGAVKLAELFSEMETSTRQSDEGRAIELRDEIQEEFGRVVEALKTKIVATAA